MQVETDPIPHLIVDVRNLEDANYHPLTEELKGAVHIPGKQSNAGRPQHHPVLLTGQPFKP